jgi:hypothetical protein
MRRVPPRSAYNGQGRRSRRPRRKSNTQTGFIHAPRVSLYTGGRANRRRDVWPLRTPRPCLASLAGGKGHSNRTQPHREGGGASTPLDQKRPQIPGIDTGPASAGPCRTQAIQSGEGRCSARRRSVTSLARRGEAPAFTIHASTYRIASSLISIRGGPSKRIF